MAGRYELGKYAESFVAHDVDFRALLHLDREDLKALGVSLGHRKVILAAIARLRDESDVANQPLWLLSQIDDDDQRMNLGIELRLSSGTALHASRGAGAIRRRSQCTAARPGAPGDDPASWTEPHVDSSSSFVEVARS